MTILTDMSEDTIKVFIYDLSMVADSLDRCLSHLPKVLKRCEDCNLVLN